MNSTAYFKHKGINGRSLTVVEALPELIDFRAKQLNYWLEVHNKYEALWGFGPVSLHEFTQESLKMSPWRYLTRPLTIDELRFSLLDKDH